uniref:Aminotransferase-like plant mobile domain-containing protein n=1 Tax=Fagus sylvatica TaxID=28930 RepID=A0A2N9G245_FAGSY
MGHAAYRRKAPDVYFPGKINSGQSGDATGEPRVPRRSWSAREGGVIVFSNAPGLARIRAWVREIWFREQEAAGVFLVRLRTVFRSGFRLGPGKILAIREFHVVHECVFFPTHPGLWINLLRVRKTLRASVATSVGKVPEFSAQPYFVGLFSRAWPCTEASLGSQDMILRTEAVGMFLMPRVLTITPSFLVRFWPVKCRIEALITFFRMVKEWSVRFSFRSGPWSGQTLVKLGQPWSNLVEFGQSSPNSGKCIPDRVSRVFGHSGPQSGQKRSGQTLVKLGQPWSNLVKLREDVSRIFFLGSFDVASLRRVRPASARAVSFCVPTPEKIPGRAVNPIQLLIWLTSRSNLGQTWSTPVKLGQTWSNLPKLREMRSGPRLEVILMWWAPVGSDQLGQTLVKLGQPWSSLVKVGQTSPNSGKCAPDPVLRLFRRGGPPLGRTGSVRATSFYLPTSEKIPRIFSISMPAYGYRVIRLGLCASPSGFQTDIPRVEEDRTGYEKVARGSRWRFSAEMGTHVPPCHAPRDRPATPIDDPSSPTRHTSKHLPILTTLFSFERCLVRAVVAGASADLIASRRVRPWPMRLRVLLILMTSMTLWRMPGITIGRSTRSSGAPRQPTTTPTGAPPIRSPLKRQRADGVPRSADSIPEDFVVPGFRYPPQGGIQPRHHVTTSLGFGPFLGIPYVQVYHPLVRCWVERFFHHTGTFHLSTCEIRVLLVDWSAILGIRFGGRAPPSEPVSSPEALEILGIDDPDTIKAYFIYSCFLGNDKSTIPTPIVGMFRDVDTLREYDWGSLTYGFYIRGLRRFSRQDTISFLGFWQFTILWAFEHFPSFAPNRLSSAPDPAFPLARRWDSARILRLTSRTLLECRTTVDCIRDIDIVFQPYSSTLIQCPEIF